MLLLFLFFFNHTATTEIYTLSLHDALPILPLLQRGEQESGPERGHDDVRQIKSELLPRLKEERFRADRKSTRLNSSHTVISYAVFCLKKKKKQNKSNTVEQHHHKIALRHTV